MVTTSELEVLRAIDFCQFQPKVICIETWNFAEDKEEVEISRFLAKFGYSVFGRISPNTIFIDNQGAKLSEAN